MTTHSATVPAANDVPAGDALAAQRMVAIVIPVYRSKPSALEAIALNQCCALLGRHPIVLACAETLDLAPYQLLCRRHGIEPLVECFEAHCFSSVESYNKLLFDRDFYARFRQYRFMLIHQLDAFVFKDTLAYWCDQEFDYIGAPWFGEFNASTAADPMLPHGGNGGLSLRRVDAFLSVLTAPFPDARVKTWDDLWRKYRDMSLLGKASRYHRQVNKYRRKSNRYANFLAQPRMYEDRFFSNVVPRIFDSFKVAPSSVGMFFAIECQPQRVFEMTARQLPFGCHAWELYDIGFWTPFIEAFGHVIPSVETRTARSRRNHDQ